MVAGPGNDRVARVGVVVGQAELAEADLGQATSTNDLAAHHHLRLHFHRLIALGTDGRGLAVTAIDVKDVPLRLGAGQRDVTIQVGARARHRIAAKVDVVRATEALRGRAIHGDRHIMVQIHIAIELQAGPYDRTDRASDCRDIIGSWTTIRDDDLLHLRGRQLPRHAGCIGRHIHLNTHFTFLDEPLAKGADHLRIAQHEVTRANLGQHKVAGHSLQLGRAQRHGCAN